VDNPELLKGHKGHYVHAAAYIYPDRDLIHIIEVKTATAREAREADIK
jgi:ribosomal protein S2